MTEHRVLHYAQIFCACIWCLLASGIIFGFAALKPVLVQEGVYSEYCDNSGDNAGLELCEAQDMKLNSMFTISAGITNVMALPVGWILDTKGPRVCGIIGSVVLFAGALMFMAASALRSIIDPYLCGYILLAVGGPFVFISCFQLANCFPGKSGTILALLTGSFDTSSALFLLYRIIYQKGNGSVTLSKFFTVYLLIPCFILGCQVTIMPRESYKTLGTVAKLATEELDENGEVTRDPQEGQRNPDEEPSTELADVDGLPLLGRRKSSLEITAEARLKDSSGGVFGMMHGNTVKEQLLSPWFYLMLLLAAIIMVRTNYSIATIRTQEEFLLGDKELSVKINHIFDILLPIGGVFAIPFIGMILDSMTTVNVIAFLTVLTVSIGYLGVIMGSFTFNLVGIILFVLCRPFYYTVVSDYCSKVFGFVTFGTVYGVLTCTCGIVSLTQSFLDMVTHEWEDMDPRPVNYMLVNTTLVVGVILWFYVKRQIKKKSQTEYIEHDIPIAA